MKLDGRRLSKEEKAFIRRMAVQRVWDGESPSAVMDSYGLGRKTIFPWLRKAEAEGIYRYELEYGPVAVSGSADGLTVSGQTLLALAGEEVTEPGVRHEAQRLMRAALRLYIGMRPLQSRAFYASLQRTRSPNRQEPGS